MKRIVLMAFAIVSCLWCLQAAYAGPYIVTDPLTGVNDWLADVRFRNFNSNYSDYEMAINTSPTRTIATQYQTVGQVPGSGYYAWWAEHNDFWITYNPLANGGAGLVTLELKGTGPTTHAGTGGPGVVDYDVTISRAPDAVTAGPVNYIEFSLWDRGNFPTFINGLTLSSLDGISLVPDDFTLATAGIDSWAIVDPGGFTLNNGFVLAGSYDLDLTKVNEGKEGDKIVFGIGNDSLVPAPEPFSMMMLGCLGGGMALARKLRRKSA